MDMNGKEIDNIISTTPEEPEIALGLHRCCSSGFKFFKEFMLNHPNVQFKAITMLNVREQKLHEQYNFDLNDLMTMSIIIHKGEVVKRINT